VIILMGLGAGAFGGAVGVLIAESVVLVMRAWTVMTRMRALPPARTGATADGS
jgi:hypothetical protein